MKTIYKLIIYLFLLTALQGCQPKNQSQIKGLVAGAAGDTIYLEEKGLGYVHTLDSVKIKANGTFKFKQVLRQTPEFYRLRLGKQYITLGIDSTSVIEVNTDKENFATAYSVKGSETSAKIKELFLAQLDANVGLSKVLADRNAGQISDSVFLQKKEDILQNYKRVALGYIYQNPGSLEAYYALFQEVGGNLIYELDKKEDSRAFGAVATSFDQLYPNTARAKHLHRLALYSIALVRQQSPEKANASFEINAKEIGYIEIKLPDSKGDSITLSSVARGQACILSFSSHGSAEVDKANLRLKAFVKTKPKGSIHLYNVWLTQDSHAFLNITENFPGVNVLDRDAQFSPYARQYNIRELPSYFLINKEGIISHKFENIETLLQYLGG